MKQERIEREKGLSYKEKMRLRKEREKKYQEADRKF